MRNRHKRLRSLNGMKKTGVHTVYDLQENSAQFNVSNLVNCYVYGMSHFKIHAYVYIWGCVKIRVWIGPR